MQKTSPTSDGLDVTEIPVIGVSVKTAFESIFGEKKCTPKNNEIPSTKQQSR